MQLPDNHDVLAHAEAKFARAERDAAFAIGASITLVLVSIVMLMFEALTAPVVDTQCVQPFKNDPTVHVGR